MPAKTYLCSRYHTIRSLPAVLYPSMDRLPHLTTTRLQKPDVPGQSGTNHSTPAKTFPARPLRSLHALPADPSHNRTLQNSSRLASPAVPGLTSLRLDTTRHLFLACLCAPLPTRPFPAAPLLHDRSSPHLFSPHPIFRCLSCLNAPARTSTGPSMPALLNHFSPVLSRTHLDWPRLPLPVKSYPTSAQLALPANTNQSLPHPPLLDQCPPVLPCQITNFYVRLALLSSANSRSSSAVRSQSTNSARAFRK